MALWRGLHEGAYAGHEVLEALWLAFRSSRPCGKPRDRHSGRAPQIGPLEGPLRGGVGDKIQKKNIKKDHKYLEK